MTQVGIWDQSNEGYASMLVNGVVNGVANAADHFQGNTLSPAWSTILGAPSYVIGNSALSIYAQTSEALITKPFAAGTASLLAVARVMVGTNSAGAGGTVGLSLRDNATADSSGEGVLVDLTPTSCNFYSLDAGVYTPHASITHACANRWVYIGLQRTSATNWNAYLSLDRNVFSGVIVAYSKNFSVTTLALRGSAAGGAGLDAVAYDFVDVQ